MVVFHRAAAFAVLGDNVPFEIDIGLVGLVIFAAAGVIGLDELHAFCRLRGFADRIVWRCPGGADFKPQSRRIAHRLHAVRHAIGHLDQEALGGDERFHAVDRDLHLARYHHPIDAVIGPEHGLGLFARTHGNILADEIAGQHFGSVGLDR